MVITMSDYLLEQEISTASCDDILFEQYMAEMDVSLAIMEAYHKQALMLEYAYTEAEGSSEKKKGFFKTIGEAIKKAWKIFCEWCANFWGKVKAFFSRKKTSSGSSDVIDTVIRNLESLPEEEKKNFKVRNRRLSEKIDLFINAEPYIDKLLNIMEEVLTISSEKGNDAARLTRINKLQSDGEEVERSWSKVKAQLQGVQIINDDGSRSWSKSDSSASPEIDYNETMSQLKAIKAKVDDKLKQKIDDMSTLSKKVSKSVNQMSVIDISTGKVTNNGDDKETTEVANAVSELAKVISTLSRELMDYCNTLFNEIDKGLIEFNKKVVEYKKKKNSTDSKGNHVWTDEEKKRANENGFED